MQKVQFSPYEPVQHYPIRFQKLPSVLTAGTEVHQDKNNMQMIEESAFRHEKMKKDVLKAINGVNRVENVANKNLPTLEEYYERQQLIYDKFENNGWSTKEGNRDLE